MSERIDDLQINGYRLIQNPDLFCFGVDAVFLSSFAKASKSENVLDLCTGNGIIPILMAAKTQALHLTGLEIQEESASLARRSISLNDLDDRVSIIKGDIKNISDYIKPSSFNVVTVNPPYMTADHGLVNDYSPKAIARHELECSLDDVLQASAYALKPNGRLYMVHRPHRLEDIMVLMRKHKIEPKHMRFIHPYVDKEPTMVLIEGRLGGGSNMRVDPPLIIYSAPSVYSEEVQNIYGSTGP